MGAISLKKITKSFGATEVIKGVDIDIANGEFVVFVGPSGCGKSTLLRIIAGLEDASSGQILIDGTDVSGKVPSERRLSMVFQSYALYPHMSVRSNIGFGLKTAGTPPAEIDQKVAAAADILKLRDYLDRRPKELSGGQRQRVAIGRAIVREPRGFLFDEPLSNLDAAPRVNMRIEIAKLHRELGATMIYVTHDQVEAMTLADRIVVLDGGHILQIGTPRELYNHPRTLFVAQFIGSPRMNVLPCAIEGDTLKIAGQTQPVVALASPAPTTAKLGVRPEHVQVVDAKQAHCCGTIEAVEYLGADTFIYVDCQSADNVTARLAGDRKLAPGTQVGLAFDKEHLHYFDAAGKRLDFASP